MNKIQRTLFLILITFVSLPVLLQGKAIRTNDDTVIKEYNTPISVPQDSEAPYQSQPIEEDLGDDDDQDKKLEHAPCFYIDSGSSTLSQFHLLFRQQHHEVFTPPPQS